MIDVEVEECPLAPRNQDVADALVLRMSDEIGEVRRAGHASDLDHPRARGAMDQQDDRQRDAEQHAVQETRAEPFALAGLWSTWHEDGQPRYSFASFTTGPNEFMKPLHEKAMPVILSSVDEQKLWLMEGDVDLLRPYEGEMEFEQVPDTLEHLYPEENRKY